MENLLNLITKLLDKKPCSVFDNSVAIYKSDKCTYQIDLYKIADETKFIIDLVIHPNEENEFHEHESIEVNERQYSELKWKIEDWSKVLHKEAFDKFEEFVESISDSNPYDELLNDKA